jgi:hypothetical protein
MSMVAGLHFDESCDSHFAYCPACGEYVYIDEDDFCQNLDDGNPEYYCECDNPECGATFYASESYN